MVCRSSTTHFGTVCVVVLSFHLRSDKQSVNNSWPHHAHRRPSNPSAIKHLTHSGHLAKKKLKVLRDVKYKKKHTIDDPEINSQLFSTSKNLEKSVQYNRQMITIHKLKWSPQNIQNMHDIWNATLLSRIAKIFITCNTQTVVGRHITFHFYEKWEIWCAIDLDAAHLVQNMMTLWNGYIFRVTGHLCGEFAGHR